MLDDGIVDSADGENDIISAEGDGIIDSVEGSLPALSTEGETPAEVSILTAEEAFHQHCDALLNGIIPQLADWLENQIEWMRLWDARKGEIVVEEGDKGEQALEQGRNPRNAQRPISVSESPENAAQPVVNSSLIIDALDMCSLVIEPSDEKSEPSGIKTLKDETSSEEVEDVYPPKVINPASIAPSVLSDLGILVSARDILGWLKKECEQCFVEGKSEDIGRSRETIVGLVSNIQTAIASLNTQNSSEIPSISSNPSQDNQDSENIYYPCSKSHINAEKLLRKIQLARGKREKRLLEVESELAASWEERRILEVDFRKEERYGYWRRILETDTAEKL